MSVTAHTHTHSTLHLREITVHTSSWLSIYHGLRLSHIENKKTQDKLKRERRGGEKTNYEMLDKSISFANKTWAINLSVVLKFRNHFNSLS